MTISNVLDLVTVFIVLFPVAVQLFTLVAQKTHNQKLINLSSRAQIVVSALEQSGLTSDEKKKQAMDKLASYAKEAKINVTGDQLDDYIEAAVRTVKNLTK